MLFSTVVQMSVSEFDAVLKDADARQKYQIVDVREPNELDLSCIPGDDIVNLPLSTAGTWSRQVADGDLLDSTKPTLCLCHHGVRSMKVAAFLTGQAEFDDVHNVVGGIDAYALQCDQTVGTY